MVKHRCNCSTPVCSGGTSESNTWQRLEIHRKTPSSCFHWNCYLLSPVEVSTEMTGEASHSCVLKQYSCYLHIALCKYIITDASRYICVCVYVCIGSRNRHALVTQSRIQNLDLPSIVFLTRLNNKGNHWAWKCWTQAVVYTSSWCLQLPTSLSPFSGLSQS